MSATAGRVVFALTDAQVRVLLAIHKGERLSWRDARSIDALRHKLIVQGGGYSVDAKLTESGAHIARGLSGLNL